MKIYVHKGNKFNRTGSCKCCGECCKNLGIEIETTAKPNGKSRQDSARDMKEKEVRKYIKKGYKNVEASRISWMEGNEFKYTLTLDCPHLKNNKCIVHSEKGYSKKPDFCQKFPEAGVSRPAGCAYRFKKMQN